MAMLLRAPSVHRNERYKNSFAAWQLPLSVSSQIMLTVKSNRRELEIKQLILMGQNSQGA